VAAAELLDLVEPLEVGRVHHRDEQRQRRQGHRRRCPRSIPELVRLAKDCLAKLGTGARRAHKVRTISFFTKFFSFPHKLCE